MSRSLNITDARRELLSLPDRLKPGEQIDVYRHQRPVLKILRTHGEEKKDPFSLLDLALASLPRVKKKAPPHLARRYKSYLYGKKA